MLSDVHLYNAEYCKGLALSIRGESLRARSYVGRGVPLGLLREKIVTKFIRDVTPRMYRVDTGFVRSCENGESSRQCDLLIHDPMIQPPLYQWDDFAVIRNSAAMAVVEVKSNLGKKGVAEVCDIQLSLYKVWNGRYIPTFGYGLSGVGFSSLCEHMRSVVEKNKIGASPESQHMNWPFCIAIQRNNILGIQPLHARRRGDPQRFCLIDLTRFKIQGKPAGDGLETGYFIHFYQEYLRYTTNSIILRDQELYHWFNGLDVQVGGKVWISADGVVHDTQIPVD